MKSRQDAVYWVNLARVNCIQLCAGRSGERTLFERLSPPRRAPKIVLTSAWQSQQQQQEDPSESASSRTKQSKEHREDQGNSANDLETGVDR